MPSMGKTSSHMTMCIRLEGKMCHQLDISLIKPKLEYDKCRNNIKLSL